MATRQANYAKSGITKVKELEQTLNELDPTFTAEFKEEGFDVERAFQLYAQFSGDVTRTATALNVSAVAVLRAADRLKWATKLEAIFELKKSGKAADVERSISRTMAFVQAHRFRVVIERVLTKFYEMSDEALFEACFTEKTTTKKDGSVETTKSVNCKPFSDLGAAMEKVHQMCYSALADTVTERAARKDKPDDTVSATQLHSVIAAAMACGDTSSPAAQLLQEQIDQGES
jgi:hypothetical protein